MIVILLIVIILILILTQINNSKKVKIDKFDDPLDMLVIPEYPELYNEIDIKKFIRLVTIEYNLVLDKFNRIKRVTYKKPLPELGETTCYRIKCPAWFENILCWKCD